MSFVPAQAAGSSLVLDMRAVGVRGEVGQIVRGSFYVLNSKHAMRGEDRGAENRGQNLC